MAYTTCSARSGSPLNPAQWSSACIARDTCSSRKRSSPSRSAALPLLVTFRAASPPSSPPVLPSRSLSMAHRASLKASARSSFLLRTHFCTRGITVLYDSTNFLVRLRCVRRKLATSGPLTATWPALGAPALSASLAERTLSSTRNPFSLAISTAKSGMLLPPTVMVASVMFRSSLTMFRRPEKMLLMLCSSQRVPRTSSRNRDTSMPVQRCAFRARTPHAVLHGVPGLSAILRCDFLDLPIFQEGGDSSPSSVRTPSSRGANGRPHRFLTRMFKQIWSGGTSRWMSRNP
mmetsp:Transcript_42161/g.132110  ORF Transcript_42161/g.132110 Transcript_42161/m.132110 type:complete len:290 (+) Transcript_42161:654-1523(+)